MTVKVYRYGLLPPIENADEVRQQMRLAHNYRNTLVEVERARRAALRAANATRGDIPTLEAAAKAATASVDAALKSVKTFKSSERTRHVPPELRAQLDAARVAKRDAVAALRAAQRALKDDAQATSQRDLVNERAAFLRRSARAHCGVYWGTYLGVEAADQQMQKMPLYDRGAEPNDPRFVRWTGEGSVGVQIQGGIAADAVMRGSDTRLRIEPAATPASSKRSPTSRRSATREYRVLALRIGSRDRDPVWGRWPMVMHRPLPDGALIKWAHVHLRKRGPRDEWSVTLTVELPDSHGRPSPGTGAVAIDIGWRLQDDGVRVATWCGSDGDRGRLVLTTHLSRMAKADELRSTRDENLVAILAKLVPTVLSLAELPTTPDWFRSAVRTIAQWRSQSRLAALAKRWRAARFEGDADAYNAIEAWRYRDFHLWEWESAQRTKTLRHRREVYRVFAAGLAKRYDTLVLEDFDLRNIARRPEADRSEDDNDTSRSNRHAVAASALRNVLIQAFAGRVQKLDPKNTTRACHACGSIEKWDQAEEVIHTCSKCGVAWDQDDNAAINLLTWQARERSGDGQDPGVARGDEKTSDPVVIDETRWQRARRLAREKSERMQAARNP